MAETIAELPTTTRDPESQESFDGHFNADGMSAEEAFAKTEAELIECRTAAAEVASEWLLKHGYFNGEITSDVSTASGKQVHIKATLTCYGLPNNADLEAINNEIRSVLLLMDGLAEQWGDEGVFRRCRDRLRKLVEG